MGYTSIDILDLSGTSCTKELKISWTKLGREYLIGKKKNRRKGITITHFSLSDDDNNYENEAAKINGFVPNVTGQEDFCINGVSRNVFKYNINLNKEGLILVKDFNILLNFSKGNAQNCQFDTLIYDLLVNNVSIFINKPDYFTLSQDNGSTFSNSAISFLENNLKNNTITDYRPNTTYKYITTPTSQPDAFTIAGLEISIVNIGVSSVVLDNSNLICNNVINSSITFNQKVIQNPNIIETQNNGGFILPNC